MGISEGRRRKGRDAQAGGVTRARRGNRNRRKRSAARCAIPKDRRLSVYGWRRRATHADPQTGYVLSRRDQQDGSGSFREGEQRVRVARAAGGVEARALCQAETFAERRGGCDRGCFKTGSVSERARERENARKESRALSTSRALAFRLSGDYFFQ